MHPIVSVVVTTKNEQQHIETCLRSIRAQTYKSIELILVDNNSTDTTCKIASLYVDMLISLGPERSAQRNHGMREAASGKYVVYFDADMILTPGLIEQCVEQMEGKEIVALYVPEIILGKSLFSRVRRFERQFYDATPIDAVRFIRKDTFVDSGGFDEILFASGSGEDWDLDKKIRLLGTVELLTSKTWEFKSHTWIIAIAAKHGVILKKDWQGVLHNESTVKMINYLKKKRYYSTGFSGYISKWGKNDPDIRKQFGFFYRSLGVFIEYRKWKLLIRNPILYMLTIILKLTVVIATYRNWRIKK